MSEHASRTLRIRCFLARIAHRLPGATPSKSPAGRCDCPFCSGDERRARVRAGMPMKHPERILRYLPDDQETLLTALAEETWPEMEWFDIIAGPPGEQ